MKIDEEVNITMPTTPTSASGDVKLGSTPSNHSKLSGNDQMSKNSLGLSPECYGYYSYGYDISFHIVSSVYLLITWQQTIDLMYLSTFQKKPT